MTSPCNSVFLTVAMVAAMCSVIWQPTGVVDAQSQESVANTIMIPDGTAVHLYLMDDLNSKTTKSGDAVRFKVRGGVQIGNVEIIAADSSVIGHIGEVGHSGFAGHSGKVGLLIDYAIAVNGTKIPLRGEAMVKGGSNGAVTAAATAVHGPAALLIRGWEADIHKGTMLNAYVSGDHTVTLVKSTHGN